MAFKIDEFISNLGHNDEAAKQNHFDVQIFPPPLLVSRFGGNIVNGSTGATRALSLQAESAELPGKTLNTITPKIYGVPYRTAAFAEYNEMSVTFYSTGTFWERIFFDAWMDLIIPRNTFNSEYRDNYVAKIVIQQYAPSPSTENNGSASNNPIYGINLFEAFPVIVAPQAVSWANEDVQRLTVTFSYTKWETSNMSNSYLVPNHSTAVNGLDSIVVTPDIGIGELSPTLDQDISNLINGFSIPNL